MYGNTLRTIMRTIEQASRKSSNHIRGQGPWSRSPNQKLDFGMTRNHILKDGAEIEIEGNVY